MRCGFPPHDLIGINTDYLAMMHVDTDPDTQVHQFNRFSLQFILSIAIPILEFILAILI